MRPPPERQDPAVARGAGRQSRTERRVKKVLLGIGIMLALLLGLVVGALLWFDIPAKASAMAAKTVCSAAFVAGRPTTNDLFAEDVLPASSVLAVVSTDIDEQAHSVTARFLGTFPRTAALVTDRGCVVGLAADPSATPHTPAADPAPWPAGDATAPLPARGPGVDAGALEAVVAAAMEGAGDPAAANTRGIAVVHDGQLLVAETPEGFPVDTGLHGWSMTKTLTGMLFWKLAQDKGLALDTPVVDAFPAGREPAWVADWRADERAQITIADLLWMRDGLDNTESYAITGNVPQMLYAEPDMAAWSADHPAAAPAGKRWLYLSATTNILSAVARAQFDSAAEYWAYPRTALFDPLGAESGAIETDTAGTWVGSSYGWASLSDWAKLGQLMMDDGRWQGTQVLPPGWLEQAITPAVAAGEGHGYGATTWLLGDPIGGECKDTAGIPEDAIAMEGHWGQLVAMVPSRDAVVVRMGWTVADDQFDGCQFLADVLATLPA
jgi:CubicO group peptidase (beta-lactamase class C family)